MVSFGKELRVSRWKIGARLRKNSGDTSGTLTCLLTVFFVRHDATTAFFVRYDWQTRNARWGVRTLKRCSKSELRTS